jgi:hypothetical protein
MVQVCHSADKVNEYKGFWPFLAAGPDFAGDFAGLAVRAAGTALVTLALPPHAPLGRSFTIGSAGKKRC